MSQQITEAFVLQFAANIYMTAQQRGSKLRGASRSETISGKAKGFDRIGSKVAQRKSGRHADTPQTDTPHSRRWCYLHDYHDGDLIDDADKIRILNDPTSEYMLAIAWALGRSMDDEWIEAADGDAVTGEDQDGTPAAHPVSKKVVAIDGAGNSANMNVDTLLLIKQLMDAAEIPQEIQRHVAMTASQFTSLLKQTQVTSSDYNTVKALVNGQVDTYLGFKFHQIERLNVQSVTLNGDFDTGLMTSGSDNVDGFRKCIAWAQDGMILGVGQDIKGRISERNDKCFSVQTYGEMSAGAVRMEEAKVIVAFCDESA